MDTRSLAYPRHESRMINIASCSSRLLIAPRKETPFQRQLVKPTGERSDLQLTANFRSSAHAPDEAAFRMRSWYHYGTMRAARILRA